MKTIKKITRKNILRKAMVFMCLCVLFLLSASTSFSNPDEGWKSPRMEKNNTAIFKENNSPPSSASSIWNQGGLNPFGNEPSPILRAKPGDGTGQKEEPLAVSTGIWIIVALSVIYGVICRKRRRRGGDERYAMI